MKIIPLLSLFVLGLAACENKDHGHSHAPAPSPIVGTWKLLTGTLIEKGDTVITDYTGGRSFIKIINDTHFSLLW